MPAGALFVSNESSLSGRPGGQQCCTREYLEVVRAAGFAPETLAYPLRLSLPARLRSKLFGRPAYEFGFPPDLPHRIVAAAERAQAQVVFLNLCETAPFAPELRRRLPAATKLVCLSHGLESVEWLPAVRQGPAASGPPRRARRQLADLLLVEAAARPSFDQVFTLAPFEAEIERWLGARRATWLPRTIPNDPLPWMPVDGRIGFVGTMDHLPTLEALRRFLPELAARHRPGVQLRLVGAPAASAREVAGSFDFVEALGPLDEASLRREAATWACNPQPLFYFAKGASTKLATGMGWRIPLVTSHAGMRGYCWRDGGPTLAETPAEFAERSIALAFDPALRDAARRAVIRAADSAPTIADVGGLLRAALDASVPGRLEDAFPCGAAGASA